MLIRLPPAPRLWCRYISTSVKKLEVYEHSENINPWVVHDEQSTLASEFESREAAEKWVDDVAKLVNGAAIRII